MEIALGVVTLALALVVIENVWTRTRKTNPSRDLPEWEVREQAARAGREAVLGRMTNPATVLACVRQGDTTGAGKELREQTGCSEAEARDAVDALAAEHGPKGERATWAMHEAVLRRMTEPEAVLREVRAGNKAAAIRALREQTGCSLRDAKNTVEALAPRASVAGPGSALPAMARQNVSSGGKWESIIGYSRAVRVGNQVFVAGTAAAGPDGSVFAPGDAYGQARRCFETIERALTEAGATMADVVRTRMFVTDASRWEEFGRAHAEFFAEVRPAATMVEVAALISPEMLIEVEVDAVVGATRS